MKSEINHIKRTLKDAGYNNKIRALAECIYKLQNKDEISFDDIFNIKNKGKRRYKTYTRSKVYNQLVTNNKGLFDDDKINPSFLALLKNRKLKQQKTNVLKERFIMSSYKNIQK